MYAVELVEFSKSYKDSHNKEFLAVGPLNLQIYEGEFFSLLGPSGCGKTTTLRTIAGFETPTSGSLYIHSRLANDLPPYKRPVNTVFQNYALFPHLTVGENIAFGLEMEKLPRTQIRQRVSEALETVKLSSMEKRYPRQLSGGQQQRVALARAIVKRPKVLLFDEPLGALDLKLRKEMQLELKHMQRQLGITFIYVTHDREEALTMSDRLAVMNEGKILQVGTPVEIYEQPSCHFVADFIGENNFLTGRAIEQNSEKLVVLVDEKLPVYLSYTEEITLGKIVTLAILPEKATIHSIDYIDGSCWSGKIEDTVYLGTDTRYIISLTEQTSIVVRQQNLNSNSNDRFHAGDRVKIKVSPDNIRLIKEG
jgi:spermidine/putrescine transport system ATP-binding protein